MDKYHQEIMKKKWNRTDDGDDGSAAELEQADNPPSVKVDVYVIEPRARREARDSVDVPAQEVHKARPHGCSYVAHKHLPRTQNNKKRQRKRQEKHANIVFPQNQTIKTPSIK